MHERSIDAQLSEAEDLLLKIKKQAEQEQAMRSVLPVRFQDNLSAFRDFIPAIADFFENYNPARTFEFFCTENGIPNFFWLENKKPFYMEDPYLQCKAQIDTFISESTIARFRFRKEYNAANQIHVDCLNALSDVYFNSQNEFEVNDDVKNGVPLLLMFGVGLGYQLGYIYESFTPQNIFIFEPDLDVFYASLYAFDWKSLISYLIGEKLGLHIFLGTDKTSLMNDMKDALTKRGEFLSANIAALCHYESEKNTELVETTLKELYLLNTGWGFFDDSISALGHSAENIINGVPFLLKNKKVKEKWKDIPVFVIANGPSLDAALPVIDKYKNDAIICACGSSIHTLYKKGIKPDIYFTVERTQTSANFVKLIDDPEFLSDILYLSSDVLHSDAHQYFEHIGIGFQVAEPMYPLMMVNSEDARQCEPLTWVNPLVGNMGLSYPILLGFHKLYLFGIDNGFKDRSHHHSRYSAYYDKFGNPIQAFSGMALANGGLELPGNFGGVVIANELFATSVKMMQELLLHNSHVECFNCGDGALIEGANALKPENVNVERLSDNKKEIMAFIYGQCFKSLNVKKEELMNWLVVPVFNEIVDVLINDWKSPIHNRTEALDKMQQQYEYIQALFQTQYHHIYRVLIGSINYCFTIMSMIVYKFQNERDSMVVLDRAIEVFVNFMNDMKKIYPSALSFQDKRDDGMFRIINKINEQP
ncbi:6-hydroxymethylpterin diphosphokinase MptE-like protein [uncultured Tolumonas sp.]|uniref:motility associated factor glycosyltransferase family protein n=1 Tax=uncultured Tolumonas sp. TaxID=263765 RepID=UPI002A0A38A4|nr:6-hydroxymethylpterin diphosphokinase MptE-like protein [uncultured Tolumonas sp.]